MSARRDRANRGSVDILLNTGNVPSSPAEADAFIFDGLNLPDDTRKHNAKPVSIFEISPDPIQPRRAVPSPVRELWDGRPDTVADMLNRWHMMASEERGSEFSIYPYLVAQEEIDRPKKIGPLEAALLDVIELAANIRQNNGLTNPVTIARASEGYRLETGERRWLAYHALYAFFDSEQKAWEKIPARIVEHSDVWRQAAENGVRANLNAISRARQLALLIMEVYRKQGTTFQSYEQVVQASSSDRAFYAQVSEGSRYDIPKGHGETILNAMGLKQSSQMREYRALLRLPDEVWQIADDLNWTQGRIRSLIRRSSDGKSLDGKPRENSKKLISLAVSEAQARAYSVGIPTPASPTLPAEKAKADQNPLLSGEKRRYLGNMKKLAVRVGEGGVPTTQGDLKDIEAMRKWLDDLERIVRENLR
ncbi:MAG TPA: ParB N-terminal domain-containing protein [Terriglobales bacterium]|nr:ParB N-terminal domain-containing protein [Terriglobales bacterium]